MARATPGPLIGSITGRVSGLEFGSGRSGMTIRRAKPKRRVDTKNTCQVRSFPAWFSQLWDAADPEERFAWACYATTHKVLNRNSQYVTLPAKKAAYAFHFRVYDWLSRNTNFPNPHLVPPPSNIMPMPQPKNPSLAFSTTEYILHAEHSLVLDPIAIIYAARGRFPAWTTIKSWRYIGALETPTGDNDLYDKFQALKPPWELLEGEHIYLRFYWLPGPTPLIPNFNTYLSTDVTA